MESLFKQTPLDIKVQAFEDAMIKKYPQLQDFGVYIAPDKSLYISDIRVKKDDRGKGVGSKLMQDIVDFADENNLIITCTPSPEGVSLKRWIKFHYPYGFVKNTGRKHRSDLGGAFSLDLYRLPKQKKDVLKEELFGKKFKIRTRFAEYIALLSRNPKPEREKEPYRITWFRKTEDGKFQPMGHVSINVNETNEYLTTGRFPKSVIDTLEQWVEGPIEILPL